MEHHAEQYQAFRERYHEFIYEQAQIQETQDELTVIYRFQIPGLSLFEPVWKFPKPTSAKAGQNPLIREMIFSLGMVELISYWKIACPPKVIVKAGKLNQVQIDWWKKLYFYGLGEFFYVNAVQDAQIDNFMEISSVFLGQEQKEIKEEQAETKEEETTPAPGTKILVPIGGGKDSAVTLELLKEAKADSYGYIINPRGATLHTADAAGLERNHVICVSRSLDKRMLELNRRGFLNGHTPFSAIVAFSSLIAAKLYHLPYIALSNESSANESTIQGSSINHQYSKSFAFEQDFCRYVKSFLPGSSKYFSLLRPLSEFQIAAYFSSCRSYHAVFRSCNAGSKKDEWCGHCPKCLFVALILSPFLTMKELENIFGTPIFEDETLISTLEQLVGIQEEKPFECVGSRREVNVAIRLTIRRLERSGKRLPKLLAYYKNSMQYPVQDREDDGYFSYFDSENLVPEPWKELVKNRCTKEAVKKHLIVKEDGEK